MAITVSPLPRILALYFIALYSAGSSSAGCVSLTNSFIAVGITERQRGRPKLAYSPHRDISSQPLPPSPLLKQLVCLLNMNSLVNKSFICQDIESRIESSPPEFLFFNLQRLTGDGLAVIENDILQSHLTVSPPWRVLF